MKNNYDRDYIGFATLPEQVHRKSVKRGFDFTLMVVGETGLGKSTVINSLFLGDLYKDRKVPPVNERVERTTSIEKKSMEIEEKGVRLRLTIIDTPGFGDNINGEESWRSCISYIDEQVNRNYKQINSIVSHFNCNSIGNEFPEHLFPLVLCHCSFLSLFPIHAIIVITNYFLA